MDKLVRRPRRSPGWVGRRRENSVRDRSVDNYFTATNVYCTVDDHRVFDQQVGSRLASRSFASRGLMPKLAMRSVDVIRVALPKHQSCRTEIRSYLRCDPPLRPIMSVPEADLRQQMQLKRIIFITSYAGRQSVNATNECGSVVWPHLGVSTPRSSSPVTLGQ